MYPVTISLNELELKLLDFIQSHHKLYSEYEKLKKENSVLEKKIQEQNKKIIQTELDNQSLKVAQAFAGNEEYRKLMKLQINKLIKEVDLCIAELKNDQLQYK